VVPVSCRCVALGAGVAPSEYGYVRHYGKSFRAGWRWRRWPVLLCRGLVEAEGAAGDTD